MNKKFTRVLVSALMLSTMAGTLFAANPKREMRSTWFTTVENIDWPTKRGTSASVQATQKQEMLTFLDKMEEMKLTSTCLQVRSMGDAMYPSQYAPWSYYLTGTRGVDPGWDPLAYFVEEAHKRGIEAYVWLNPYRWSSGTQWSTDMDKAWKDADMLITGDNGTYVTYNPALPETRQMIVNVVKEILNNYAIDGVIFDDYFYPSGGTTEGSSAPDYSHYKASGTTMSMGDWRRRNVNDMVADVYNAIKELKPDVRFGISPAGVSKNGASRYGISTSLISKASDWQYAQIYSDPLAWLEEGTVDFVSPQLYWITTHSTNGFGPLSQWWSDVAATYFDRHFYASHSVSFLASADTQANWTEMGKQINYSRQYTKNNAPGSIYFSTKNVYGPGAKGLGTYLINDQYSTPALVPVTEWKSGSVYGKVADLKYENGTLTWTPTVNGNAIIRYTVYAMPMNVTIDDAKAADGDGFDVKYLQKVVYGNSFVLPTEVQANYWYVVCVYDGYGREHEATIVNYPEGESEVATLVSPVDGVVAAWEQQFSWSNVSDATYTLEISDVETFSTIVLQEKNLDKNVTTVDLSDLESAKTYFWRVRTSQKGKLESVSEVESFVTSTREAAPQVQLVSPENGAKLEEDVTFVWTAVECDEYTIEMSDKQDFSSVLYKKTVTDAVHPFTLSILGKGTFYWRVKSSGKILTDTYSAVNSFEITKITVGNFEAGYTVKIDKDNDSYEQKGNVAINSIWFRSVADDYKNIQFGSDGSFNRTFCVVGNTVYMSGRSENSSGATPYLRKFDGQTGEILGDIILGDEAKLAYYPCNQVMKDSKGNICIANLSLNISSTPVVVHKVDLETGALTQIASLTYSGSTSRCDHVTLTGDVEAGNFSIYGAFAKAKVVVRWNFENGVAKSQDVCSLATLYPTTATALGTAPRVIVIDDNSFFVIGGETQLARYDFATGKMTDSFTNNMDMEPVAGEANGGTWFTMNGTNYMVYPYADFTDANGHQYNVVKTDENLSFKSMELMWTFPKNGMGAVSSTTFQADADYVKVGEGMVRFYVFVPGNGLCAYELVDTSVSGLESVVDGVATEVARYDLSGRLVANPVKGINIVKMSDGTVKKVIVK